LPLVVSSLTSQGEIAIPQTGDPQNLSVNSNDANSILFLKHNSFFAPDNGFSTLKTEMSNLGFNVVDFNAEPTASDLSSAFLIIISSYMVSAYSGSAKTAIQDYVANGGNAMIIGESGGIDLGISTLSGSLLTGSEITTQTLPHPAIYNATNLYIPSGTVLSNYSISGSAQINIQTDAASNIANYPLILTNHYGKGDVLATTLSNLWTNSNIINGDNLKVITNFISMIQEPTMMVTFGLHNSYFSPTNGLMGFATVFTQYHYIINDLNTQLTSSDLGDTDILVLSSYMMSNYDSTSQLAIESYVSNGGNVIIVGESGGVDLGISTTSGSLLTGSEVITEVLPHPAIYNATNLYIPSGTVLSNYSISGSTQINIQTDAASNIANYPLILTNHYGQGDVLTTTLSNLWTTGNINNGDNVKVLHNFISMIQEPTKMVSFGLHNSYFSPTNGLMAFATVFTQHHYIINDLNSQLTSSDLGDTDILILSSYMMNNYDSISQSAIKNYTTNGGSVVIVGESGGVDLGISTNSGSLLTGSEVIGKILPHPTINNATNLYIPSGTVLSDYSISGSAQINIQTDAASNIANYPLILTNTFGHGNVLTTTLSNLWTTGNINNGENMKVLHNFVYWIEHDQHQVTFAQHNSYFSPSNGLSQLANNFAAKNFVVYDLNDNPSKKILQQTDILVINTYLSYGFNGSSITAIRDYVRKGGGVLIIGDSDVNLDLGLGLTNNSTRLTATFNPEIHKIHPILRNTNVNAMNIPSGVVLSNYNLNVSTDILIRATEASSHPYFPLLLQNHFGRGHVLGTTISNIWSDSFISSDNLQPINNFISIVLQQSPYPKPVIQNVPDLTVQQGETFQISWVGWSPVSYKYHLTGPSVHLRSNWQSGDTITFSRIADQLGTFNYTLTLIDVYDFTISDTVSVHVEGSNNPPSNQTETITAISSTTVTVTDTQNSTGTSTISRGSPQSSLPYPMLGMLGLIIIPVIIRRRKS